MSRVQRRIQMIAPAMNDLNVNDLTRLGASSRSQMQQGDLDKASPEALRAIAQEFEATFLAEMLKHTGLGEPRESFGGGPGESAFAGMLTQEYAAQLADRGGVGLADRIYSQLLLKTGG
ncbi:MAG: rod-binding protein [Paracoccaceae bacterium]